MEGWPRTSPDCLAKILQIEVLADSAAPCGYPARLSNRHPTGPSARSLQTAFEPLTVEITETVSPSQDPMHTTLPGPLGTLGSTEKPEGPIVSAIVPAGWVQSVSPKKAAVTELPDELDTGRSR